ncbi:MAG: glycoside hydrolase family 30 protein [Saprospiraceae bacterium]|nr:glycoside hydrolase family 30 protein [Saprospiraceae bacterium]
MHIECQAQAYSNIEIYETSSSGNQLTKLQQCKPIGNEVHINIYPSKKYQTILGFGGAFTESSAYVLNKLSKSNREKIIEAYFSANGANYSLTRTHINSCDFSLSHYCYASVPDDFLLENFTIQHDLEALIPMIADAIRISPNGFKIIASPWTSPPWMKDNNAWVGGKLLPKYYQTWALYFSKYIQAYEKHHIPIWGITVENEPLGNGNNWESLIFTPKEMTDFVQDHLSPQLKKDGLKHIKILGFDQNRGELPEWVDEMYRNDAAAECFDGSAVHWYGSTFDYFPTNLQYAHKKRPDKYIIQTEACIDADIPRWKDDAWYWSEEATDWGWEWAKEEEKYLHPKYVPVFRYARDIIGCLNNYVNGWIDWNMVLNKQGGPNWFKNWCIAPVIADNDNDEIYFTPLYYAMSHFSKFIRPNAERIGFDEVSDKDIMFTSVINEDKSIVVVILNSGSVEKYIAITIGNAKVNTKINAKALQTVILK